LSRDQISEVEHLYEKRSRTDPPVTARFSRGPRHSLL
jgi:hypothetical protein